VEVPSVTPTPTREPSLPDQTPVSAPNNVFAKVIQVVQDLIDRIKSFMQ
jgi:hypothetical protein